jgi:hypothetical protein
LCNLTFVGVRSCMTVYQVILVASWVGVLCRFLHTVSQSVSGRRLVPSFSSLLLVYREGGALFYKIFFCMLACVLSMIVL